MTKDREDNVFKAGRDEHPSYGTVSISRVTATPSVHLFDSPFKHSNFITLTIDRAYKKRSKLASDLICEGDEVVKIMMSEAQFSRMVSTQNYHGGTPCTIARIEGADLPDCPKDGTKQNFQEEMIEKFEKVGKRTQELSAMLETFLKKPRLNVREKKVLKDAMRDVTGTINDGLPFLREVFAEYMDKIVQDAKSEIDLYASQTVKKIGLGEMAKNIPQLEEGTND